MEKEDRLDLEQKEVLKTSFKKTTEEDVAAFLELERAVAGGNLYSGFSEEGEVLEEFKNNEVYLMYKGDKLAGSTAFQMKNPDHAYLAGLVVHPDFQGQGLAREAALFRLEKLQGVKRIDTVTHPNNFKIIELYESLGFKIEKQIENYYGDGEPRVMLAKES